MPLDPLLQAIISSRNTDELARESRPDWAVGADRVGGFQSVNDPVVNARRFAAPTREEAEANVYKTALEEPGRLVRSHWDAFKNWADKGHIQQKLAATDPKSREMTGMDVLDFAPIPTEKLLPIIGMIAGAKGVKTAGGKYLAQFEAGKAALELNRNPQEVMDLYGVFRRHDGSYAMELPLMAKNEDAIAQFKKFYPNAGLKFTLREGPFEGSYNPITKEVYASGRTDVPITHPESLRGALEHEMGAHAVQDAEGWGYGARPQPQFMKDPRKDPNYWKNPQEVEARNMTRRLDLNQRRFLPEATADVPKEEFILKNHPDALAAAVKEPGGMWHPEAVERLAAPLGSRLGWPRGEGLSVTQQAENEAAAAWSQRAIRNYLNKYAGTTRDPLKDVEIPFGEGSKRWEELMDDVVRSRKAKEYDSGNLYGGASRPPKTPDEEAIWNLDYSGGFPQGRQGGAIQSYLSHVGDYLRQNVPPEKLQQYDLVRAVKETAANDARVAAEAMKEARKSTEWKAAQQSYLPTYKEYPDQNLPKRVYRVGKQGAEGIGLSHMNRLELPAEKDTLSWREIKVPEKLNADQAKFVRRTTPEEASNLETESGIEAMQFDGGKVPQGDYVAVDAKGKVIIDNFTHQPAVGRTPEEAWTSGQLATEGNSLAHCVGGYCEDVARGESKIYSLRDSKGRSHATVEVKPSPEATPEDRRHFPEHTFNALSNALYPPKILQIKGPGNQAPSAEYLPYVQDFVKSGKWGEVGDLENTGLAKYGDKYLTLKEEEELLMTRKAGGTITPEEEAILRIMDRMRAR